MLGKGPNKFKCDVVHLRKKHRLELSEKKANVSKVMGKSHGSCGPKKMPNSKYL